VRSQSPLFSAKGSFPPDKDRQLLPSKLTDTSPTNERTSPMALAGGAAAQAGGMRNVTKPAAKIRHIIVIERRCVLDLKAVSRFELENFLSLHLAFTKEGEGRLFPLDSFSIFRN
jgi:hypothetical protein